MKRNPSAPGRRRASALLGLVLALGVAGCEEPPVAQVAPPAPPGADQAGDGFVRRDVRFACGETECAAWLYLPARPGRAPVVVMAHGFAGTRDVALPFFAERFAREGLAALVFDYRHFGASGGSPRQLVDPWRQLDDWRAALAFARGQPDLDPERVALWATSLGAGHALLVAAEDRGLRAVVAQAPQVDSAAEGEATFYGVGWALRLLGSAWLDLAGGWLGRAPFEIPAIARAGEFGMLVDDRAYAAFETLVGPESHYRNAVAARGILTFDEWNPAGSRGRIDAPLLLIASRADRFAPFSAVESYAAETPNARLVEIDGDHFDVYASPVRERAADLAAAFLARELAPTR
jgi:pimeloyl-ACP methyl ester carboxylesterase